MIELILSDGRIAEFPDGTPKQQIAAAVAKYYGVWTPQEGPPSSEAIDLAETAPDAPQGLQMPSDMPSDPSPDPASAETRPPRVRIEAYQNDPNDPANVRYPHPVDYPTGVDPANPFKDNFHWNWRRR